MRRPGTGCRFGEQPPVFRENCVNSPALVDRFAATQLPPYCPAPPPQDMGTRQSAEWWNALPVAEQQAYLQFQPASLGAMDGLPADVRHEANLQVLREDAASGHDRENAQALLDRIEGAWSDPGLENIYLLDYQPPERGSDARVVATIGNPDTADNIGIYVPGTGSDLASANGGLDRADDLRAAAEMVPGSGQTATVYWLGYDAPNNLLAASGAGYASDGAGPLREFTQGLRESSTNPDVRVTVIGHSYGSTVIGHADAADGPGLAVDDIVVMGSPGVGTNSIDGLHIDGDHFWAGMADDDSIRFTPGFIHGTLPVNEGFGGGTRIDTGDASGHSGYWEAGGESIRNQAYIITGNYGMVSDREHR